MSPMTAPQEAARTALARAMAGVTGNHKPSTYDALADDILTALQADPDAARAVVALLGGEWREEAGLDVANRLETLLHGVIAMAVTDDARRSGWQAIETPLRKAWLAAKRLPLSAHTRTLPAAPQDDREAEVALEAFLRGFHLTNGCMDAMNAALSGTFAIYSDEEAGTDLEGDTVTMLDKLREYGYVVVNADALRLVAARSPQAPESPEPARLAVKGGSDGE